MYRELNLDVSRGEYTPRHGEPFELTVQHGRFRLVLMDGSRLKTINQRYDKENRSTSVKATFKNPSTLVSLVYDQMSDIFSTK